MIVPTAFSLVILASYWVAFLILAESVILQIALLAAAVFWLSSVIVLSIGLIIFSAPISIMQKGPLLVLMVIIVSLLIPQQSSALGGFLGFFIPYAITFLSAEVVAILEQINQNPIECSFAPVLYVIILVGLSLILMIYSLKYTEILATNQ